MPRHELLSLNKGDFIYSRTSPTALPVGTTAEIIWENGVNWPATVTGNTISWRIESEDCTAAIIPHGTAFDMLIHYPNGATSTDDDFHWKTGTAHRTPTI
ncbi:DUF7264 domain-containing protein [Nocardia wallacei]|uniref:LtfC-like domain-containing protein n=1 Tax=Nocardia wallacei TaxID=480035 RepID=UPI0024554685|nr:hypothetical protein [Nocardia wallacei]